MLAAEVRLANIRKTYAEALASKSGIDDPALVAAFSQVPREAFLGEGPWLVAGALGLQRTPDDDPAQLYRDVLVAIDPLRRINNGEPGLHFLGLSALGLRPGQAVAHIGVGTGYYSAIIAVLVGPRGRVDAFEAEPHLAERAARYLAPWPQVTVHGAATADALRGPYQGIYVSAGVTAPRPEWFACANQSASLVFPLVTSAGWGAMVRLRGGGTDFALTIVSGAGFILMKGGVDEAESRALEAAFRSGAIRRATHFRRGPSLPDEEAILSWSHGRLVAARAE
jgi:protein-L-isoaspartate(D-aspartate) O-methyltransferase